LVNCRFPEDQFIHAIDELKEEGFCSIISENYSMMISSSGVKGCHFRLYSASKSFVFTDEGFSADSIVAAVSQAR
jgi:hypothetical protein